jgi:hypothetical protein
MQARARRDCEQAKGFTLSLGPIAGLAQEQLGEIDGERPPSCIRRTLDLALSSCLMAAIAALAFVACAAL